MAFELRRFFWRCREARKLDTSLKIFSMPTSWPHSYPLSQFCTNVRNDDVIYEWCSFSSRKMRVAQAASLGMRWVRWSDSTDSN